MTVLIVEDDKAMQEFIENVFYNQHNTIPASTAEEAKRILENSNVDLIICDVMLGEGMDGFDFCKLLKTDINFSHIPFIILTARTDNMSKITGFEIGANAYIEKPFSVKYLKAQVISLLEDRQKMFEYFSKNPFSHLQHIGINKTDEEFMAKIIDIIHKNISDEEFNIDKLSEILLMSRSTLYRKIKSTTQLSPNEFIRLIRLKKAAEYLYEGKYRVNEVVFLVGLKSSAYFTKAFHRQFGVLPKDFGKKRENNPN
jgi:DNA-binding response OmpR family regulator